MSIAMLLLTGGLTIGAFVLHWTAQRQADIAMIHRHYQASIVLAIMVITIFYARIAFWGG